MTTISPILQPPTLPIIGNAHLIDKGVPIKTYLNLAKKYGPIYQLTFPDPRTSGALKEVRHLIKDGLFAAYPGEATWGIAHQILSGGFGPAKIKGMFGPMVDIASQLVSNWEVNYYNFNEFGSDYVIDAPEDLTRLTSDTITLCAMSCCLNSFYTLETVPFVKAMGDYLTECGNRAMRSGFVQNYLSHSANVKFEEDKKIMVELTNNIVAEDKKIMVKLTNKIVAQCKTNLAASSEDLLQLMLTATDPVTGLGMTDGNITHNLVTVFIAGHETMSELLSFTVCAKVDAVLKGEPIHPDHLSKLTYIVGTSTYNIPFPRCTHPKHELTTVLHEALRLTPPLTTFAVKAMEDQIGTCEGKQYLVPKDLEVDIFRPERMLDGGFEKVPVRILCPIQLEWQYLLESLDQCIETMRPLAWQESIIAFADIFQKFDLVPRDPSYQLLYKSTLTVKPRDFKIHAKPRPGAPSLYSYAPAVQPPVSNDEIRKEIAANPVDGVDLYLAYGSSSGTCKDFAQRVGSEPTSKGFIPHIVTLDSIEPAVPTNGPVLIFTASYEGEPANNASRFIQTIQAAHEGQHTGVKYAVFGCGHHDWKQTHQKIPKLVDGILVKSGATRLMERMEADSGADEFFDLFDTWVPLLWETLGEAYEDRVHVAVDEGVEEKLSIELMDDSRAAVLKRDEATLIGKVISNRILTAPGVLAKHHIEIDLSEDTHYEPGDYLSILPRNPEENISRALSRFNLLPDQAITIKSKASTTLPTDKPVSVWETMPPRMIPQYDQLSVVELNEVITRERNKEFQRKCLPARRWKKPLPEFPHNFTNEVIAKCQALIAQKSPEVEMSSHAPFDGATGPYATDATPAAGAPTPATISTASNPTLVAGAPTPAAGAPTLTTGAPTPAAGAPTLIAGSPTPPTVSTVSTAATPFANAGDGSGTATATASATADADPAPVTTRQMRKADGNTAPPKQVTTTRRGGKCNGIPHTSKISRKTHMTPPEANPPDGDNESSGSLDVGNSDAESGDETPDKPSRPGALSKDQLTELRDKGLELEAWIEAKAREFGITPLTIYINMGLDDREKRVTSFWNKFQNVFWNRVHEPDLLKDSDHKKDGGGDEGSTGEVAATLNWAKKLEDIETNEDGILPPPVVEYLQALCSEEYTRLTKPAEDLPQEEKDTIAREIKLIESIYNEMHDPDQVSYREGNTLKLMRTARKEFTTRALYYSARGIVIAGWVVSTDPIDATASAANFMFAGSDSARAYFDEHAVNIRATMRDFETFCRFRDLETRERKIAGHRQLYLTHRGNNDRRRKECSRLLKELWGEALGRKPPMHLRWDEWPNDMIAACSETTGWPDAVPFPGGPHPYKAIDLADNNIPLWEALCGQNRREIKIEPWPKETIDLYMSKSAEERIHDEEWLKTCLVRSHTGQPLLTIGGIANARSKRARARLQNLKQTTVKTEEKLAEVKDEDTNIALDTQEQPQAEYVPAQKRKTKKPAAKHQDKKAADSVDADQVGSSKGKK
ncbi:hypothetical protein M422DRAFT_259760 [Sphaerobolus stellatus SS14]|uniref:Flavodoxin-like domain-containing protein n=1 Tax=Sphaerobolus stellatus (strain SS14) TaxID=990650 RepID=A0A0C9V7W8_SPHS4|nr:hypothetical protein M422DRAFT_259760 [Sphaerobolus stellatus SS14]